MAETPAPRTILLVEDNPDDRARIQRMLRGHRREFHVVGSPTGEAALKRLADGERFDCVLLDYRLPDMLGTDFLHRLRDGSQSVAVCMITGQEEDDAATAALELGAEDYLLRTR